MNFTSVELLARAARGAMACAALAFVAGFAPAALAQGEADDPFAAIDTIPVEVTDEAPAPAAPARRDATELDTIEVTGSRIRRTDYETAQPVVVVTRADIERTGLTNIGDILQRLPAAGSALNRTFNNGGTGQTEIDLRNLGSHRLLVLVNGHRWVNGTSFSNTSSVDLNTIPVSIIERVEILKDGASAVYGSEAIAGVVNIITRKDFSGVQLGSQVQAFEDGEGLIHAHHLSFGNVTGKTSMFLDFNFVKQEAMFASARPEARVPKFGTSIVMDGHDWTQELVHTRGSIIPPEGYFIFVPTPANGLLLGEEKCPTILGGNTETGLPLPVPSGVQLCLISPIRGQNVTSTDTPVTAASKFRYNNGLFGPDLYLHNYAPINYYLTPYQQNSVFGQINHQFLDWLNFSGQVLYNVSKTAQALAETPARGGDLFPPPLDKVYIDATQMYNPFLQDIGRADEGSGLVGLGAWIRRFIELGPRFLSRDTKTTFMKGQFDGSFDTFNRLFSYDVGYSFGRNDTTLFTNGDVDAERLQKTLGPAIDCPSAANPECVPLNVFSPVGTLDPAALDYIRYSSNSSAEQQRQDVFFNLSTEFHELSGLLAGPVGVAFGAEYRDEYFADIPDPFVQSNRVVGFNNRRPTSGQYNVVETYVELALPLVSDKPFVRELDLSLAGRYTKYNTFEDNVSGKLGLRWKPIDDLLVRTTVSEAFRAPSLTELFLGGTIAYPLVTDPCVAPDNADVEQNCIDEGADGPGQLGAQIPTLFGGNENLVPETALTMTAGFVYSPSALPDFNIYVDYFRIDMDDFIGFVSPAYILSTCYGRPAGSPRPATCDLVERDDGTGTLTLINSSPINFAKLETEGVDIAFDYILPLASWLPAMEGMGTFKFAFDSQYLTKYDQFVPNSAGEDIRSGLAGLHFGDVPLPRYKANAVLEWTQNNWKASWATRYIKGTTESCVDGFDPSLRDLGLCSNPDQDLSDGDQSTNRLSDIFYHNLQVVYMAPQWNSELVFGVNNVLNTDPPISYMAFANSVSSTVYEIPDSRQPYLRLKVNF
jgi:iron complex outermembrane recepter protein